MLVGMGVGAGARRAKARYEDLFRLAPFGMLVTSPDGAILDANGSASRVLGYSRGELLGRTAAELHILGADLQSRLFGRGGEQGYVVDEAIRLRAKSGDLRDVILCVQPIATDGEQVVVTTIVDVTEHHHAEERRRAAEEDKLSSFLEAAPDGVVIADADGKIVRVNAQTEKLFGHPRTALVGQPLEMLLPERLRERHRLHRAAYAADARARAMGSSLELVGLRGDGSAVPVEISLSPLEIDGAPLVCGTIRDVSERKRAEARTAALVESLDDAVIGEGLDGIITSWNPGAERIFGYHAAEIVGAHFTVLCPPGRDGEHAEILRRVSRGERVRQLEVVRRRKDGRDFHALVTASPVRDIDGRVVGQSKVIRDVTAERRAETERQQFFELSLDLLCTAGIDGYFRRLNPAFRDVLGYELEELTNRPFLDLVHPDDVAATLAELQRLASGVPTMRFENRYRCKDGSYKWLSWRTAPAPDGTLYAVARDMTAEKETELAMRGSLKEKEVLLQEVHHRVKNNLQVIASLINMQLRKLADRAARDALEECQARVLAIALIHEKLYQSKDYALVPFYDYLKSLAGNVFHATGVSPRHVTLELDIAPIAMPVDKAIPCGLIINELMTNALKHAFPDERKGRIRVALSAADGRVLLSVEDDGAGLPPGFDVATSRTLGLQLVTTLTEQLDATLEIKAGQGTKFLMTFDMGAQ
jgi:PAS domain S-box-containing protein